MKSVNSYQDILTPEEIEERELKRKLREEYEEERRERIVEAEEDSDGWRDE